MLKQLIGFWKGVFLTEDIKAVKENALNIRRKVVEMSYKTGASHVGSSLSCADILAALYFSVLRIDPKKPSDEKRDRFILSKGHAVPALYTALALRGFFPEKQLEGFHCDEGTLWCHPTRGCVAGIEATTGSLGHGLSIGIGMALAGKLDKKEYMVFVLLSDGECDEGSTWEAGLEASHLKLDNLTAIIDYNKLQAFGRTNEVVNLEPLSDKWKSFGFSVREVDGHNLEQLMKALKSVPFEKNKPSMIIANTIKGKGVSYMENKLKWHYKSPNDEEFKKAMQELK